MAILEIARIQVRRGDAKVTGLPTLNSGEFGWAVAGTDAESTVPQLFIGNGTAAEGGLIGPGSTRILTQYDNVINLMASESYAYTATHRAPILLSDVAPRSIQSKLDDFVTVYDFGEVVTAESLQTAIDQLFLKSDKNIPQSRVALRIPAGDYSLDNTVYIPPYATILGDGQGKTVLSITDSSKPLFQFCDQTSTGTYVVYQDGATNIGSSTRPTNVNLTGLTLKYGTATSKINAVPLIRVDCAIDSVIRNCKFQGSYATGNTSDAGYVGIDIRGQGVITTENLIVDNCTFDGLFYGVKSNYDIADGTISNSIFRNLRRAIVFRELAVSGNSTGPVRTRITLNKFENIEREGIYVGASSEPTYHASSYNTFYKVGESGSGYPIINFISDGNTSSGDIFRRFFEKNEATTEVVFNQLISGRNYTEHNSVYSADIVTTTSPVVLGRFPYSGDQSYKVQYSVVKSAIGVSRKGELLINVALLGTNTTATITESYTYAGSSDGGVEFSVGLNTATTTLSLGYTSPDSVGTISYKFNQFR